MEPKSKSAVSEKCGGFTLVEVLIVLVVLGTVAGLMIPVVTAQIERSRSTEAVQHMESALDALKGYRALNGSYSGATFLKINYDPNQTQGGQKTIFSYTLSVSNGTSYTITAQREPAASNSGNTLDMDQTGKVTPHGAYV